MDIAAAVIVLIIGTFTLIGALQIFVRIPDCGSPYGFAAVVVLNRDDDVEMKIDSVLRKLMWTDDKLVSVVILVNNGLSPAQEELCRRCCGKNRLLVMSEPENIGNIIIPDKK